ncbi:MAG: enoyl-CoA hydratase-related protein [Bacteroidetes bacterium]|nr:enoyl-CoA hydratase-related protein [Bacteroidota bacterium]MDE2673234.1 enoyl-CoA hydratase-related protein [Bacteroidota bacterium]
MSNVHLEICDFVAKLTLDRPAKRNALTPAMLDTLEAHLATVESSRKVRVVTLSGAGDKAFCAGADITAWGALDALGMWNEWIPRGQRIFSRLANLRQPVIALMNGYAFGGGLELALACDIRIAASTASFAMPEVKIAAVPGWSGTARLANIIGIARAKMMILTGDPIDAQTALAWGLVTRVCLPDQLSQTAGELIATISSNAPIAVQMSKQLLDADCAPLESIAGALSAFTDDGQEGVQSFSERRQPDYKGT